VMGGLHLTLPPGPLCDEGMILFMEGGCDWGESNIFFFCKVALLVTINAAFAIAWLTNVRSVRGFVPHFVVLTIFTLLNLSGGRCDTYYSHPNGSFGQMSFEAMAFAFAGIALVTTARSRSLVTMLLMLFAWNAFQVGVFYLGLTFTNHWTWTHSFFIALVLTLSGAALRRSALTYVA